MNPRINYPEDVIYDNKCDGVEDRVLRHIPTSLPIASFNYRAVKPFLDLLLVLLALPILLPLGLLIAALIKVTSNGSVLYRHHRIGQFQQPFWVWKFRTMYENSDEALERHLENDANARHEWIETHKLRNDPRVTPIGKFLRKTSLDEIPQFINVLVGNMTIVGPRPIVDKECIKYGAHLQTHSYAVPGITGLWQVSGRCEVTYDERVLLDVHYVRQWSLAMEFKILLKTAVVLLRRTGAY
ncbi:MAG: sugar transferase [Silvibacterium sp.]